MVNKPSKQASDYYPPTKEPFLDTFEQNNKSYQLFKEQGLDKDVAQLDDNPPHGPISTVEKILSRGLFRRLRPFLVEVDSSKGPIQRKVIKLERRRGTKNQEFLVVHTEWIAKNYLGNDLVSTVVLEGMYNEPVVRNEIVKGKVIKKYANWNPVYDILFSKEAVDQALENQINEPELIKYMVRTSQTSRDDTFSLEQFRDSTFAECVQISKDGKGLNR